LEERTALVPISSKELWDKLKKDEDVNSWQFSGLPIEKEKVQRKIIQIFQIFNPGCVL